MLLLLAKLRLSTLEDLCSCDISAKGGGLIEGVEAMGDGIRGAGLSAEGAAACREYELSSEGDFDRSWERSIL